MRIRYNCSLFVSLNKQKAVTLPTPLATRGPDYMALSYARRFFAAMIDMQVMDCLTSFTHSN